MLICTADLELHRLSLIEPNCFCITSVTVLAYNRISSVRPIPLFIRVKLQAGLKKVISKSTMLMFQLQNSWIKLGLSFRPKLISLKKVVGEKKKEYGSIFITRIANKLKENKIKVQNHHQDFSKTMVTRTR